MITKPKAVITREKLLSSILTIGRMLTRPVSIDTVLNAIVRETQKFFGLNRVAIFLVNKEARLLECRYLIGFVTEDEVYRATTIPLHLDKHNCRETLVARTGQTVFIKERFNDTRITATDLKMDEYWKRVSTITAPLKIRRDVIGVLEGDSTDGILNLSRKEISLFTFFANQAGIIVENARLQSQNQRKIEQLLLLQQVTKRSSAIFKIPEFMDIISANAMKMTKAQGCLVSLVGKEGKHLNVISQKGSVLTEPEAPLIGRGIIGRVAETGAPTVIYDTRENAINYIEDNGIRSLLAVPMISEQKVLGVVSVFCKRIGAFTANDMEVLSIMAGHAAVLLRNANLYEQVIAKRDLAENILERSPNGIITVDSSGRIQSVNSKAEQILEVDRKDISGRRITDINCDSVERVLHATLHNEPMHGVVEVKIERESNIGILEIDSSFVKQLEGNRPGIIITIQDVTKAKATDELIRRMDRLSSLGQLSAGIAHEIRNPLAGINLNIQILLKKLSEDKESAELLHDSLHGITRINGLVKSVLDFAKPAIPQSKKYFIQRVLVETVHILAVQFKKNRITAAVDLPDTLPAIVFDRNQIRQVFINILLNAVEAMPRGGIINITGVIDRSGSGSLLRLFITDNGSGIPQEHLPKIFDPFFTTKPEGTGLGLSIVHKILEQHKAMIEVESSAGRGTTFTLTFPMDVSEVKDESV